MSEAASPPDHLTEQASEFASELEDLLNSVMPGEHVVRASYFEGRYRISPRGADEAPALVRLLTTSGEVVGGIQLSIDCILDSWNRYLAVEKSSFAVLVGADKNPLLRYDFRRDMHSDPVAHWQVHAERGAMGYLHTKASHDYAGELKRVHLPVGGSRMRPCFEDLLQVVIQDCGVAAKEGWQHALDTGRVRWRRKQIGAAVRDAPDMAVQTLRDMGYEIIEPDPPRSANDRQLSRW